MATTGTQIMVLHKEISKLIKQRMKHMFDDIGLTAPQLMVVGTLKEKNSMKVSEISQILNLSNSTISGIVDRLEKMDFVQRIRDEKDRRVVLVSLTETAKKKMKVVFHDELVKNMDTLMMQAEPEEIEIILMGLKKFKSILEKGDNN